MSELQGTATCDICGKDSPHSHYNETAEIERFARPTFEFQLRHWLAIYLPRERARRGLAMGVHGWTRSWQPQRSKSSPPDYVDPAVETMWGFWLNAWMSKPSWCDAYDDIAKQKQIERQTVPAVTSQERQPTS